MTFTMIRTFCVFNALVFLAGAVAYLFGFGEYAIGAFVAFSLLNAAGAVLFDKLVARRPRAETPKTEAPKQDSAEVVSIAARELARKRWG